MQRRFVWVFILICTVAGLAVGAAAQDGQEKSGFVRFLEGVLSTPERQVTLTGLKDALSSHPTIERIDIADRDGVWLSIESAEVVWNRLALLNRELDVDVLRALKVTVLRKPVPGSPDASSRGGLRPPPLAIDIAAIAFPNVTIAAPVVGVEAELSVTGLARLNRDAMAAQIAVERQDRAGRFSADLALDPAQNLLTAQATLEEPADGLAAGLLGLKGRPALTLSLSGSGPLDRWQANLEMQAAGRRAMAGAMSIVRLDDGYQIRAGLGAALDALVPDDYAALFAGDTRFEFDVTRSDDGRISVSSATLHSDGVDLSATGVLAADLFPESGTLNLVVGGGKGLRIPGRPDVSATAVRVEAALDPGDEAAWRMTVATEGLESNFGRVAGFALNASGNAHDLAEPAARSVDFKFDASVAGLAPGDAALANALGQTLTASGNGAWRAGAPVSFDALSLVLTGATLNFAGDATAEALSGSFDLAATDLSRYAAIAGRPLRGKGELTASGSLALSGLFDLKVDGTTTDLALGVAPLDPFLVGETHVAGGVARTDSGLRFDSFSLSNPRATAEISGNLADPALDLTVNATVADLSLATPRAKGKATLTAQVTGSRTAPRVEAEATGENLVLMDRPLAEASATFSGVVAGPETAGHAEISGTLGESAVRGVAELVAGANGERVLRQFRFAVGKSEVAGDLTIGADGLLSGDLNAVSPDLAEVAPLFLVDARGAFRADIALRAEGGGQSATVSGRASNIVYETTTLESAEIDASARDLFGAPEIDGRFSLRALKAGGLAIPSATGTALRQGDATVLNVNAALADGSANLAGVLSPRDGGLAIVLQSFAYKRPGIDVALGAPTEIEVANGTARFDSATLKTGGGSVVVSGAAGSTLDLTATLKSVPAALVNALQPSLGAEGAISGTVTAQGTAANPNVDFELTFADASVAASRNAGLAPVAASASGALEGKTLSLKSRVSGAGNLAIDVAGTVGIEAGGPLALRVTGNVPLSLGNPRLASRGAALEGVLAVDMTVGGNTSAPQFSGRVTSEGGGFVDPESGITLKGLTLAAEISGNRIVIQNLAAASGEGRVAATGTIGLDANAGFPLDLTLQVRQARYVDGTLIASRFDADLKVTGTLAEGPLMQGSVFLDRTEVTVPEKLPSDSVAVDVKHVDAPAPVARTLAIVKAPADAGKDGAARPSGAMRLDVAVSAPQQIFVRGRGLDAEFGGDLRLVGPINAISASGGFEMRRGRLDILTQRISFDRGIITFAGDLDPILEFSGSTRSGDVTITVTISGRASDPEVVFSSVPQLPQDEILAQLIFQKGIGELSPLQAARLAAAASELAGGQGGILSRLRASTGLDDLDIVTDEEGQTSVAAGRYISENVYIGVQQGATAESSRVTIDLNVTKDVKARAGMSAEGDSSLGIFFEREY